ncbi:hypothetical protein ACFL2H_01625 [Planctomycetota bacterium]
MSNPYESPNASSREPNVTPMWYVWFYKAYWPAWWIGTILIALSWFDAVTPTVGWAGFALAGVAALGSYVLPSLAGVKQEDYVILDSRLLNSKGSAYHNAIERFRNGASLMYDGVAFGFRPNNEIACGVVADTTDLDDTAASEIAAHAQSVFDKLISECSEFKLAVADRTFRISIMSGVDQSAREICRVVDGKLNWQR